MYPYIIYVSSILIDMLPVIAVFKKDMGSNTKAETEYSI
jgi:hypothetical protein